MNVLVLVSLDVILPPISQISWRSLYRFGYFSLGSTFVGKGFIFLSFIGIGTCKIE